MIVDINLNIVQNPIGEMTSQGMYTLITNCLKVTQCLRIISRKSWVLQNQKHLKKILANHLNRPQIESIHNLITTLARGVLKEMEWSLNLLTLRIDL